LHLAIALALAGSLATSCGKSLSTAPSLNGNREKVGPETPMSGREIANEVVITLAPGVNPATVAASYGATLGVWDGGQRVATLQPNAGQTCGDLVRTLAGDPRVVTSESNVPIQAAEARQKSFAFDDGLNTLHNVDAQPALAALHTNNAHMVSDGGGIKVAILDTGIDPAHPLFAGHIVAAYDFVQGHDGATDVQGGVDTNNDGVVDEAWGHGTHVAGIVALTAPGAQLLIGRVLDSDGQGDVLSVAAGIRWATQNGARIINLSLGTLDNSSAIASALEDAERAGVVIVASAGNQGAEFPQEYPARSSDVTAAVAACDVNGVPTPWTSYGRFVELTAPGVAIRSAYPGGVYRQWSGTSMAAPFVSGTAALLLALHAEWSPSDVRDRIVSTVQPLTGVGALQLGKLGAGMLDIGGAIAPDAAVDDPVGDLLGGFH
jgi:subtilisin family serine protease